MPVERPKETPSQTAGPYVHIGTLPAVAGLKMRENERLNAIEAEGERIRVQGLVLDGSGAPVKDAMIELWQADAKGRLGEHGLFGRTAADFKTGEWLFETVKPGAVSPGAPFLTLLVFARGINIHLHTRMYFPEDAALHDGDPALSRIEQRHRVATLIAEAAGPGAYRFTIRLQGEGETVFFDI